MATKKASKKVSKKASKKSTKKAATSQAGMIRQLLAKKVSVEKIVARVKAECGGNPTAGYVNAIAKHSK